MPSRYCQSFCRKSKIGKLLRPAAAPAAAAGCPSAVRSCPTNRAWRCRAHSSAIGVSGRPRRRLVAARRCARSRRDRRRRCRARPSGTPSSASRATSSFATRGDQDARLAVVDDVGELVRRQVRIDAGVIEPGPLAGAAGLEVAAVVLHEDRIVVEPLQPELAQQMRQAIAARLELAIGHGLAGRRHDEGGLQRTQMSMLAGIHRVSHFLMRPEEESRAPARANRSCAGCAVSMASPSPVRRCGRNAQARSGRPAGCAACRARG